MNLDLTETTHGEILVLGVGGEIDVDTSRQLTARLNDVIRPDARRVVVDLSGTSFIDSAGLSVLVDAQLRAEGYEVELIVICPEDHRSIHKLFEITGLDTILTLRSSMTEVD